MTVVKEWGPYKRGPEPNTGTNSPLFEVVGAGWIEVRRYVGACGSAVGASFGCSWGSHGYAGGVMDASEVRRLIAHLESVLERMQDENQTT